MPLFTGPSKEYLTYGTKFVRVKEVIYVGSPNADTSHLEIVIADRLQEAINRSRFNNPQDLDAGFLGINSEPGFYEILISGDSADLELPVRRFAEGV